MRFQGINEIGIDTLPNVRNSKSSLIKIQDRSQDAQAKRKIEEVGFMIFVQLHSKTEKFCKLPKNMFDR